MPNLREVMALTRWILALCGYARLEVCGVHPERVLNACAAAGSACTASEPVDAYTLRITVRARMSARAHTGRTPPPRSVTAPDTSTSPGSTAAPGTTRASPA